MRTDRVLLSQRLPRRVLSRAAGGLYYSDFSRTDADTVSSPAYFSFRHTR